MKKEIYGLFLIVALFVLAIYFSTEFADFFIKYIDPGFFGMLAYFSIEFLGTVAAPISTIPFIPIAVEIWGPFLTAIINVLAWTAGGMVAFLIAKKWGRPGISLFVDLKKIEKFENLFGKKYLFLNILLIRMIVPVDILSYAIGILSSIKLWPYTIATLIGVTPFAFILSYTPNASPSVKIIFALIFLVALYINYLYFKRIAKKV